MIFLKQGGQSRRLYPALFLNLFVSPMVMAGAAGPLASPRVVMLRPIVVRSGAAMRALRRQGFRVTAEDHVKVWSDGRDRNKHVVEP